MQEEECKTLCRNASRSRKWLLTLVTRSLNVMLIRFFAYFFPADSQVKERLLAVYHLGKEETTN